MKSKAEALHKKAIVFNALDSSRIRECDDKYIGKLRSSGTTAIHLCVAAGAADEFIHDFKATMWYCSSWWKVFSRYPEDILIAETPADVERAKKANKVAVMYGVQNVTPLDGNLELLPVLRKVGITMMQLTYQRRSLAGDGCAEKVDGGLSKWGRELVQQMNDLGMVVDLGHSGTRTSLDAIACSRKPVVISHACLRSLSDSVRNHTDDEIKAMAAKGGVIGIAGKSKYLKPDWMERRVTIADYVDHIEYIKNLVGIDHVGIGTDIGDERKYNVERLKELYAKTPEIYAKSIPVDDAFVRNLHPEGL
ncbi:MAG: dipeptidase, partial [Candidatus Bipolaricaulia bacterium]